MSSSADRVLLCGFRHISLDRGPISNNQKWQNDCLLVCSLTHPATRIPAALTIREDRKAYLTLVRVRACAKSYQITYANPSVATSSRAPYQRCHLNRKPRYADIRSVARRRRWPLWYVTGLGILGFIPRAFNLIPSSSGDIYAVFKQIE